MLRSTLDDIKGIGNKSKEILLKNIGSVDKIRKARFEELKILSVVTRQELLSIFIKTILKLNKFQNNLPACKQLAYN